MAENLIARWSNPGVILVATNLFEGSELLLHAIHQARLSHAKVLLVHAVRPSFLKSETFHEAPFIVPMPRLRSVRARLNEMVVKLNRESIDCEPIVLKGLPEEQIPLLARSRTVDRVMVATRNVVGVARLVGRSVAEELIARMDVPVCVIGPQTRVDAPSAVRIQRILLATSFYPGTDMLARFARQLAASRLAQLTLLNILDSTKMTERQLEAARSDAMEKLAELGGHESHFGPPPIVLVRVGDPATIISAEGRSSCQDLIILGSSYSSAFAWPPDDSVVHRVIGESPCPVITLKPAREFQSRFHSEPVSPEYPIRSSFPDMKRDYHGDCDR